MGRRSVPGPRRAAIVAMSAAASLTTTCVVGAAPAAAAVKTGTASPKLTLTSHTTFWDCPAKTTEMLVAVNTLTLHPGTPLDISFIVRNTAPASCNYTAPYASVAPGPTASFLTAGPCGSVGFEIEGPHHRNVWPGPEVVNCPALGFAQLAAGATVSGAGSWDQTRPNSTHRVPPGSYTLVVENKHFTFPLHVMSS